MSDEQTPGGKPDETPETAPAETTTPGTDAPPPAAEPEAPAQ